MVLDTATGSTGATVPVGDGPVGLAVMPAPDSDGDGVPDDQDVCWGTPVGTPVLTNGCSVDQQCPCMNTWKNHGAYVSCVSQSAETLLHTGKITQAQQSATVSTAARSACGGKK